MSLDFKIYNQFKDFQKKKFYFIVGAGRCGRALFSGLIDKNKNILIMHHPDKLLKEISYIKTLKKKDMSQYILEKNFLKRIKKFDENKKKKFKSIFDNIIESNDLNEKKIYFLLYFCYAKAFDINLEDIEAIFFDAFYSNNFLHVEKFFFKPKFIYLARNPYDLFMSLKNYYFNQYLNSNNSNTVVQNVNFYSLDAICLSLSFFDAKREYILLKYEDMWKDTKNFLKNLSNNLRIKLTFNEKLTYLGSPKVSDSSFYTHTDYVNKNIQEFKYKKMLLNREINLISLMFNKYFYILGYEIYNKNYSKISLPFSFIFLFKNEFIPHKKLLEKNENFLNKMRYKNLKPYLLLRFFYYILKNFIFYPKNIFKIMKIIILQKK